MKVYMVRVSYNQKPYRKMMMETWGASCVPSPSPDTSAGRGFLAENPDHPGSLGIAISEAVEDAVTSKDTRYSLGSVLNHVLMHQTIIGLEARSRWRRPENIRTWSSAAWAAEAISPVLPFPLSGTRCTEES